MTVLAVALFCLMPLYAVAVSVAVLRLRAAHRLVCRDAVRYAYAAHTAGDAAWWLTGLLWWHAHPTLGVCISCAAGLIFACDSFVYYVDRAVHDDHEVDCRYGPPPRRRGWWVARPAST